MYCNKNHTNSFLENCAVSVPLALLSTDRAEGSLTNYKKVVDKEEKFYLFDERFDEVDQVIKIDMNQKHYGLTEENFEEVRYKLKKQKMFLKSSYLHDKINNNNIPLADLVLSANHSPKRYYSEIQNRVNTLVQVAKERNLAPIFMTLTLPSEWHRCKTSNGKLIYNSKYNDTTAKEASKELTRMFARLRQDRALKELTKENRIYFRANEEAVHNSVSIKVLIE
jgi:hypothetical protein